MKTKHILLLLISMIFTINSHAQMSKELTKTEIEKLNFDFKKMPMPVANVFEFEDKGGIYNLFFFEDGRTTFVKATINGGIEAICYLKNEGGFQEKWQVKGDVENNREGNIWFWTKYCAFKDLDGDGFVEPIIVYATSGIVKTEIEQIKIITVYQNEKYVIKSPKNILSEKRKFTKDAHYKELPKAIKIKIEALITEIEQELIHISNINRNEINIIKSEIKTEEELKKQKIDTVRKN